MAVLMAGWSSRPHWLYLLANEVLPSPGQEADLAAWPNASALGQAESQLRQKANWRGMKEFAEGRLALLDEQVKLWNPQAANEWSGVMINTDGKTFKPTRKEQLSGAYGKWTFMAFEAAVEEGRTSEARWMATRLQRDGDQAHQRKAFYLAEKRGQTELAALLKAGLQLEKTR